MKLKTLKDFRFDTNGSSERFCKDGSLCHSGFLKQEAIKWIKYNNPQIIKGEALTEDGLLNNVRLLALNSWIKHFFNIQEKDLE